jgi:hypothetical protein
MLIRYFVLFKPLNDKRELHGYNFFNFLAERHDLSRKFGDKGKVIMKELFEYLDSDCRFILNLLVSLYEKTMDKIESVAYNVFNGKHELNSIEIFRTTVDNSRLNSINNLKILRLGFGLVKKSYPKFLYLQS